MRRALVTVTLISIAAGGANVALAQRTVDRGRTVLRRPTPAPSPAPTTPRPATPPSGIPGGTATPAGGGVYRVTLTGFHVNHETYDTPFETDGKGDEIRIMATVEEVGPDGRETSPVRTLQTPVYGDINNFPSRIQAGSRSSKGGLRTGDSYPASSATLLQGTPQSDRLPLLLWQGTLRPGAGGVAIAPMAFEIDSGDVLTSPFSGPISIVHTIAPLTTILGGPIGAASSLEIQTGDRPIGVVHAKNALGGAAIKFTPQVVTITSTTAEEALAGKGGAIAPGLVEVRYRDPSDMQGDYSLYLRVERVQ